MIGIVHPDFGEGVVAVIQSRDQDLDETKVIASAAEKLARFKQPKRVLFVPELPRNSMGKVQKKLLREQYSDLFAPLAG